MMRSSYDFRNGVRGKYVDKIKRQRRNGYYGTAAFLRTIHHKGPWPDRRGEKSSRAKITEKAVCAIRRIEVIPRSLAKVIAGALGIHPSYVYHLKAGKRWKHL